MQIDPSFLSSISDCDQILIKLNFNKKDCEYKQMGYELRAEKYEKRYNLLEEKIIILKEDIAALELAINAVPDGNIKSQLDVQLIKALQKLFILEERIAKLDLTKVVIWQSMAKQMAAMLMVCDENIRIIADRKAFLLSAGMKEDNYNFENLVTSPAFFEELINPTPTASNAVFIDNHETGPDNHSTESALKIVFKKQLKTEVRELAYYQ